MSCQPTPKLVLDLRPTTSFAKAHIAHSTHIHPIEELKLRYSCLPPRNVAFLVIAESHQEEQVRSAIKGCDGARFLFLDNGKGFWDSIAGMRLVRSCDAEDVRARIHSVDDRPHLLFRPSNAVRRLVKSIDDEKDRKVLDLGCGAGRDLAWILYRSSRWQGVGLDNWKAALGRAQVLMRDLELWQGKCQQLVWAKSIDDGELQPLVGTGKGRLPASPATTEEEAQAWSNFKSATETSYDLILCIRFFPRPLLPRLRTLVKPGGRILISHFTVISDNERCRLLEHPDASSLVIDYDSPPPEGRLQPGEAQSLISSWNASRWSIESDILEPIEDGRIIRSVILRRTL